MIFVELLILKLKKIQQFGLFFMDYLDAEKYLKEVAK